MVDMSSIVGGLQAIERGLAIVRAMREAGFAIKKSELQLQVADVTTSLADAKMALIESREKINTLESEIGRLSAVRNRKFRDVSGMYLETNDAGQVLDGAFCSRCRDVDWRFVRILERREGVRGWGVCPQCKAEYKLYEVEGMLPRQAAS